MRFQVAAFKKLVQQGFTPQSGVSFTVGLVLLGLVLTPSAQAETKVKGGLPFTTVPKREVRLNYPKLPHHILKQIKAGKPLDKTTASTKVDSAFGRDWALSSIGFFEVFTPLVQPLRPREVVPCDKQVVVAVIDTGIDYTHPELRDNIWINHGESGKWEPPLAMKKLGYTCRDKSCNGIDDDGNGFVDDVVGWDFVHDVPLPYDTHGHGSHIAGIIAGAAGNGLGASGVCAKVSIMPLKYYDNTGIGYNNLSNTVRAIHYAVKNGADIINYSGGGSDPAPAERAAVAEARKKGVLFVAAAGNDGRSNDRIPYYPASYGLDNIVSVASVNKSADLLPSSNFGKTVHVAAPGLMILSALPAGRFGSMSGTSQATAFVTGAAALLLSQSPKHPLNHYRNLRKWIVQGTKPMKKKGAVSGGLLSLSKSLGLQRVELGGPSIASSPEIAFRRRTRRTNRVQPKTSN